MPKDLNHRQQPPSSVNVIDKDREHQEAPPGPLNTMSEGQEQSFTTSPPSENVFNNTTRYPNKDMIMNEKVSHKNSHLVVYNTLISL